MKKSILIIVFIFSMSIMLFSCYYDKEDLLYPNSNNCDTTHVTYGGTVQPILQGSGCLSCHSGVSASGGIQLDNYNGVKIVGNSGRLYGAISHSPGYQPMPQGGNKMTGCDISKIKAWINSGTLNN